MPSSDSPQFGILATGVDLFFVLSGFLMVAITDESTRPGPFLLARMRRIVPLYWLITTVAVVLMWGGLTWRSPIPFWHIADYDSQVPASLIAASYAFVPWWNPGANMIQPVVPLGWTLNLEMMFYLLVGLSLLLSRRWQFAALFVVIAGLAFAGIFKVFSHPALVGWTNPLILEFLVGAWIGFAWQKRRNLWRALGLATIVVAGFIVITGLLGTFGYDNFRYVTGIPYAALLVLVLGAEDRTGAVRRMGLPLLIGNASYAIYLVQFVVHLTLGKAGIERGLLFGDCMICITLLLGVALHRYFELPIMRAKRQSEPVLSANPR